MKVVVCVGYSIGDDPTRETLIENWKKELEMYDIDVVFEGQFSFDKIDEIFDGADAVIGAPIPNDYYTEEFFDKYPKCKYIATYAHGYGTFDKKAANERGIVFTNTIYGDVTIAQYAMALLLEICHSIRLQDAHYKETLDNNEIIKFGTENSVASKQIELYEQTFGILGLGNIGLCAARMAHGFGMKVIAHSRSIKTGPEYDFIEQVSFDEMIERSDVISIHCPLTEATEGIINKESIAKMKDGVIIINTARGLIINEPDLKEALDLGKVYAAGLDVVVNEPITEKNELMSCENTVITPHIAWAAGGARLRMVRVAAENLKNWIDGKPSSTIN